MIREGPTEPISQVGTTASLPGAVQAAQTIQAQVEMQETMAILADQLLMLLDELPSAGLNRQKRRAMQQHIQTYFRIADGVWEALATDHLAELTSNPSYNVAADTLEQKLVQLHEECRQDTHNPKARGGWLWRRRTRLYSRALLEWKRCIDISPGSGLPDPTRCGRVLYRAHSRVGLASITGFDHALIIALPVLGVLASLLLTVLFGMATALAPNGLMRYLAPTVISALIVLYILWFSTTGPSPLPLVVGYALARRQAMPSARALRVTGISWQQRLGVLRTILRALLAALGSLFVIVLLALLALTVFLASTLFASAHNGAQDVSDVMTGLLRAMPGPLPSVDPYLATIALPVVSLFSIALFFLPFTLSVQVRLTRALIGHPPRSPEARRYALRPALEVLSFHTITFFFAALLVNSVSDVGAASVLPPAYPPVSSRLLIALAALMLPYLLLIDLPYRQGVARWRATRLRELSLRRDEIAQRLSRAQPQTLEQATLHTVQDYVIWQYYHTQESEVSQATTTPFSFERRALALILMILVGFALDQINALLHNLL